MTLTTHETMAALLRAEAPDVGAAGDGRLLIVGSGQSGISVASRVMGSIAVDEGIETVLVNHRAAATRRRPLRPQSARLDLVQALRHRRRWRRKVAAPAELRAVFDRFAGVLVCGPGPLIALAPALGGIAARTMALIDVTVPLHADQNQWPDTAAVRRAANAERAMLATVDQVASVSSWCAWSLVHDAGVPADRVVVVPPSVHRPQQDPALARPRKPGPLRLIAVGRPAARKGMDRLVQWLEARPDLGVEVHLVGGSHASDDDRLTNHGSVDHEQLVADLLPSMDLLVHPTRRDQSSTVIAEAATVGVPALAMALGGIPELIDHGRTGWLVRADSRADLFRLLDELVADPEQLAAAGRSAAHSAQKFDATVTYTPLVQWLAGRTTEIVGGRPYDWGLREN